MATSMVKGAVSSCSKRLTLDMFVFPIQQTSTIVYVMSQLYSTSNFLEQLRMNSQNMNTALKMDFLHQVNFKIRPRLRPLLFLALLEIVNILFSMFISGDIAGPFIEQRSPIVMKIGDSSNNVNAKSHRFEYLLRHGGLRYLPSIPKQPSTAGKTRNPPLIGMNPHAGETRNGIIWKEIPVIEGFMNHHARENSGGFILKESPVVGHINPHDFSLMLDEPDACFDKTGFRPKDVFLLVLVTTIHENSAKRQAIRETWGSPKELMGKNIVTLFLLASNKNPRLQRRLEEESLVYRDILQEDFTDTYKNLTLKTVMGMKWVSTHCSHASFVMKTDDDMFVSYLNLMKYLTQGSTPSTGHVFGFVIEGAPIRDPLSKWYMPRSLYHDNFYPPFLSGTGYVLSADVVVKVYKTSLDTKFLYLEDVFVGICLKALHINPRRNKHFHNWQTFLDPLSCQFHNLITTHMVTPTEMHVLWNDHRRVHQQSSVCNRYS